MPATCLPADVKKIILVTADARHVQVSPWSCNGSCFRVLPLRTQQSQPCPSSGRWACMWLLAVTWPWQTCGSTHQQNSCKRLLIFSSRWGAKALDLCSCSRWVVAMQTHSCLQEHAVGRVGLCTSSRAMQHAECCQKPCTDLPFML